MIVRTLTLHCDYCDRTTRIKGSGVTEEGLYRVATRRGWRITPHSRAPQVYSPDARCPRCAKSTTLGQPWAERRTNPDT